MVWTWLSVRTVTPEAASAEVVMWVAVMSLGAQSKLGMVGEGSMNASSARRMKSWGLAWVRSRVLLSCQWEDDRLRGEGKAEEDLRGDKCEQGAESASEEHLDDSWLMVSEGFEFEQSWWSG